MCSPIQLWMPAETYRRRQERGNVFPSPSLSLSLSLSLSPFLLIPAPPIDPHLTSTNLWKPACLPTAATPLARKQPWTIPTLPWVATRVQVFPEGLAPLAGKLDELVHRSVRKVAQHASRPGDGLVMRGCA